MPRSVSDLFYFFWCVHLHVCFPFFFVGEKVSYRYIISFFEKSSNLDSMKLRPTNVCLWKSTRTVLHSKYPFCSKDANQTGNTSSLLVHCLINTLQLTVVMPELTIASMNVRGIGNNNKRRETFNWGLSLFLHFPSSTFKVYKAKFQ